MSTVVAHAPASSCRRWLHVSQAFLELKRPLFGILVYVVLLRLMKSLAAGNLIMIGQFESRIPLRLRQPCRGILKWTAGCRRTPATAVMPLIASYLEAEHSGSSVA